MRSVVPDPAAGDDRPGSSSGLLPLVDELVREGAQRMLAEAVQAEGDAYLARFREERDEHGHRVVVRSGYHQPRQVTTMAGAVEVRMPRVNDMRVDPDTGERQRFASAIQPPWARKTPKIAEVLPLLYLHGLSPEDYVPKSAHPGVKKALAEIWNAEDRRHAVDAVTALQTAYGAKFPKAVAKVTGELDQLLAFYDYPAEHWQHLRATNPIESTVATVRYRSKVTKGPGSRAAGPAMAFKLIESAQSESAQSRWRAINAPHLVALIRAGARFEGGKLVERPEPAAA
ncbi:MAG: hypothetical protein GEV28_12265 [Actinophytocola sp.]|uniref:transposase n=1 Tax=Actinophytocola sp. TaxID=1872138 RepID=UPI001323DBEF|nr:transposase [Actinophytocola sp.]MPZ81116.1 hypothetical protein [Actinophytocola sp.]